MAISLEQPNLEKLKISAVTSLNDYLDALLIGNDHEKKKSALISYWVDDYVDYLKKENSFDPSKLIRYKRGNIIKVNLGFRIGSEQGGLHYAIVLDAENSINSNTLTIVPLSSLKPTFKPSKYSVKLKSGAFKQCIIKVTTQLEALENKAIKHDSDRDILFAAIKEHGGPSPEDMQHLAELRVQSIKITQEIENTAKLINELHRMKSGSVALLSQMTTVSKQRIFDPVKSSDPLYGIKLSDEDLDIIDNGLKALYFKKF